MRYPALALAVCLVLTGCTGSVTDSTDPGITTTTSLRSDPTSTTSIPVSPTVSTVPPTTIPTIEPIDGFTRLPVPDETDPFTLDSITFGDRGLVYTGNTSPTSRDHPNEAALWHFDGTEWSRTLVGDVTTDEYWGTPWVTDVE